MKRRLSVTGGPRRVSLVWLTGVAIAAPLFLACAHQPGAGLPVSPVAPATAPAARAGNPAPVSTMVAHAQAERPAADPAGLYWRGRADLIRPPAPPPAAELALPPVENWTLKNGMAVVAVPRRGLPIVSFSVAIKAGGYDEQKDRTQGVADFVAAMLRKGTRRRGAEEISEAIDSVGGSLDAAATMENSTVSCSVLAKNTSLCLNLLSEMLLTPTFPRTEMAEIRDQMLASLAARTDDPHQLAAEHFDNLLFGEDHPDGWVLSEKHVQAITREALVAFWRAFYRPNNAMLAVAGDFDARAMKDQIARAFGPWQSGPVRSRPVFKIPPARGIRVLLVDKPDLSQATLMFGHAGLRHGDPDWYAATLVNYVLGGSDFSSRLMTEVRSKRGLTYGISSSFGASLFQGAFRISAATRNETARDALSVAIDEIRKMKAAGPTASELGKAKGYYAGSIPFELESAAGIAHGLMAAELHGLGAAYVRQLPVRLAGVDETAARAAALSRLDPDDMAIVIVGKASAIEPQLRKKWGASGTGLPFERIDYRAPISAAARRRAGQAPPGGAPPVPPSTLATPPAP